MSASIQPPSGASNLPAPTAEASAHGEQLARHIRQRILAAAKEPHEASLSFADFMRAALYEPGLGYYAAGATKLGAAGDFVTAPELSPLFGAALADAFAPLASREVLELGAGSGRLARSFIDAAPAAPRYSILDLSADLRERQQTLLAGYQVSWLDALPQRIDGLVVANEVLDAVPCEIVRFSGARYEQAHVAIRDDGFVWAWRPLLDGPLLAAAKLRLPPIEGYTSEINLEAEALAATLAGRLRDGALCFIDYGFPRREYFLHDRVAGTLACHYQHRVHFDPLVLVGLQDITAHVDFTAIAEAAVDGGASVVCYCTQAQFLLQAGLLQRYERHEFATEAARARALGPVQKLLSPTEMGELFKVLVVANGSAIDALSTLSAIDQSYRL